MKLTKLEFKGIIKECIKELLDEGAFDQVLKECIVDGSSIKFNNANDSGQYFDKDYFQKEQAATAARRIVGYGELVEPEIMRPPQQFSNVNPHLKSIVENTANAVGKGNQEMANAYAAILADTAVNTLPKMLAQESAGGGYSAMIINSQNNMEEKVNPVQLQNMARGGDVTHWAKLAFGGNKK